MPHPISHLSGLRLLLPHKRLGRKPQPRARRTIKDDKLALKEDVSEDREADTGVRLDTTKASRSGGVNGGIVDIAARHDSLVGSNTQRNARQLSAASISVTALCGVHGRTGHFGVVGLDDGVGEVEQGRSGIGNRIDAEGLEARVAADAVAVGCEFPEALAGVDGYVGDGAVVLRGVDLAEAVGTRLAFFQVGGEQGGGEGALGVGEEGLLGCGLDSVDVVEGEAEEAVVGDVADELCGDGLGELDGLAADACLADFDKVGVDVAGGGGAVAVADGPGVAGQGLGGLGFLRVIDDMTIGLRGGLLGREDPSVLD